MFRLSKTTLAFPVACVLLSAGTPANASTYTVLMLQVPDASQSSGFDVVATGSGTINITNLSFTPVMTLAQMVPSSSVLITGGTGHCCCRPSQSGILQWLLEFRSRRWSFSEHV
jgi:hypothetical protein